MRRNYAFASRTILYSYHTILGDHWADKEDDEILVLAGFCFYTAKDVQIIGTGRGGDQASSPVPSRLT